MNSKYEIGISIHTRIEKHDVQSLLALALYDRYGEDLPKQLWINKDMKKKVQKIVEREVQHLGKNLLLVFGRNLVTRRKELNRKCAINLG